MTSRFAKSFPGVDKPLIAMAHVPPLSGTPLYDAAAGVKGLVDYVKRETELILEAGFDTGMFCNEGDRPYQLKASLEAEAAAPIERSQEERGDVAVRVASVPSNDQSRAAKR